jgi:hypothetical protein
MKTDELIDRLGRDVTIVTPLRAPGRRTALWLLWGGLYLALFAVVKFGVMSTGGLAVTPLYLVQQGAALLMGITAARAALASVIPGAPGRVWGPPLGCGAVWIASLLWGVAVDVRVLGTFGAMREADWPCVASMAIGGAALGGPLMWMASRGAPLAPQATGFLAGLAALSLANVEACLTRPHAFAMTVLLWHGTTATIVALVFAGIGHNWLRWPEPSAGSHAVGAPR